MATYSGRLNFNSTGKTVSGVLGIIYDFTGARKDTETTDSIGKYSFKNLQTGPHTIKWYGKGYGEEDDLNVHVIDETDASELQDLIYTTNPTFTVTETENDNYTSHSGEQTTVAKLSFAGLTPSSGNLRQIVVEWKRASKASYDNSTTFTLDTPTDTANYTIAINMYDPSLSVFDFKVRFLNDIAQPALNNGTTITVLSEDVEFNGVPDLQEMVGVSGLAASNVTSMYGNNSMGSDAPSYVNTSSINLVWDSINSFSSYPQNVVDATGVSHTLTEEQANRAGTYNIYMFIASGTDNPSSEFPGVSSTEGTWHKVGETSNTNYEVNCPINSAVGFWVGFMDDSRQTSVTTTEVVY